MRVHGYGGYRAAGSPTSSARVYRFNHSHAHSGGFETSPMNPGLWILGLLIGLPILAIALIPIGFILCDF